MPIINHLKAVMPDTGQFSLQVTSSTKSLITNISSTFQFCLHFPGDSDFRSMKNTKFLSFTNLLCPLLALQFFNEEVFAMTGTKKGQTFKLRKKVDLS